MKKMIFIIVILISMILINGFVYATGSGDVNNDGRLDIIDALLVAQYYVGMSPSGFIFANADLNDDNKVDIIDALLIAQIYVGIIPDPGPGAKIIIPHQSWPCAMPGGIPVPEDGSLVFEANMQLDQIFNMGRTQYGDRQVFIIKSGTITGTNISGSVMSGGLDFQLDLSNGTVEIEQLLVLRTNNGSYIFLRSPGTGVSRDDVRMVWDFEAPNSSSYSWLNSGKYAGRRIVDTAAKTMRISVYDVSGVPVVPDSSNSITVTKPSDVEYQSWDYRVKDSFERNGSQFITENVTLGGSISIGASKRGSRNIIPITGGTVTGNINGVILSAGADYQNLSNPMTIDARYLWRTNDGEIIIVRNGGTFGSLVPTFEVRENSSYSYINDRLYLSSDPGGGAGGVQITFYESTR
ncbi:MAG: DUF3237 family protein [Spirochaetales bacterium]|nr:DUF3237 family protein [Spirochaetales bacterium]